jgi:hypothetical protein
MLATRISGPCIIPGRLSLVADERASRTGARSRGANGRLDSIGGACWVLVLPDPQDLPASIPELRIGISVSALVGLDLLTPEVGIADGPGRVLGAAVPEAAIDEDCYSRRDKSDINASTFVG